MRLVVKTYIAIILVPHALLLQLVYIYYALPEIAGIRLGSLPQG